MLTGLLGAGARAQAAGEAETVHMIVTGRAVGPDGRPARGALVTSHSGRSVLAGEDGRFLLEVEVPEGAESVELTALRAVGQRNLQGRATAAVVGPGGATDVGVFFLEPVDCLERWLPSFGPRPGFDGQLLALAVYDDGSGPALFAAGNVNLAQGTVVANIARWDGSGWSALGGGVNGTVYTLCVYDDGNGAALYVGGSFTVAGGSSAIRIARWNGTSWSNLGSGLNNLPLDMEVWDDGSGPALYVAGGFTVAGGVTARRMARWNGTSWSALASGLNNTASGLAAYDDGSGPALYAGGVFSSASGVPTNHIARWDGASWTAVGGGTIDVSKLLAWDDGSGPVLVAAGQFGQLTRWDGTAWSSMGDLGAHLTSLAVFDDGAGPALYAGGWFTTVNGAPSNRIARWDGTGWVAVGVGTDAIVSALLQFEEQGTPALFVAGDFSQAGGATAWRIARTDGTSWTPVGAVGLDDGVLALKTFDDGAGTRLYVAGAFQHVLGVPMDGIARWDGTSWEGLAPLPRIYALEVFDSGGPALIAGGGFSGGVGPVLRWTGTSWTPLGSGLSGIVRDFVVFDDGSGPTLVAAGAKIGNVPAGIARWDGVAWSQLGSEVTSMPWSVAVFDAGAGPELYAAAGFVTATGATSLARWDGTAWVMVGGLAGGDTRALLTFDDGTGMALYGGGSLTLPGGTNTLLARWDGASWQAIGGPPQGGGSTITCLASFDDGRGSRLYASGGFTQIGGVAASHIARWNGTTFETLGPGLSQVGASALEGFDAGDGPVLFAGGSFTVPATGDAFLGRWLCAPDLTPPVLQCPPSVFVLQPIGPPSPAGQVVTFMVSASDDLDPAPLVTCVPPSGSVFPLGTTMVLCTATDASENESSCTFPVSVVPRVRRP